MNNEAVIVLDMLTDFLTGELKCERPMRIIPNVKRLVASAHKHKVPVVCSNDAHLPIDEEVVERGGKRAMKGTKGAEVIPELRPLKKDYSVEKRTYSAFHETGLDMLLRRLYYGAGVKTVILTGDSNS